LRQSGSFKVADFGPIESSYATCSEQCKLTSYLVHTVSTLLQISGQIFAFDRGCMPVFNTLVLGEPLNSSLRNLTLRNQTRRSAVQCKIYFDILNRLDVNHG